MQGPACVQVLDDHRLFANVCGTLALRMLCWTGWTLCLEVCTLCWRAIRLVCSCWTWGCTRVWRCTV